MNIINVRKESETPGKLLVRLNNVSWYDKTVSLHFFSSWETSRNQEWDQPNLTGFC